MFPNNFAIFMLFLLLSDMFFPKLAHYMRQIFHLCSHAAKDYGNLKLEQISLRKR